MPKRSYNYRKSSITEFNKVLRCYTIAAIAFRLKKSPQTVGTWQYKGVPFLDKGDAAIALEEMMKDTSTPVNRYKLCPELALFEQKKLEKKSELE